MARTLGLLLLALCTLVHVGFSFPACDSNALLPCLLPTISYALSPEGQKLTQLKDGGNITEPQLTSVCRLGQTTASCLKDYADRCVEKTVPDIHEFLRGTDSLMSVCDNPNLYASAKTLMTCNKQLNATSPLFKTCHTNLRDTFKGISSSVSDPASALEIWQSGRMLRDMCCSMKKLKECLGTEVQDKCTPEAARLDNLVFTKINEAYSCAAKVTDCSA